MRKYLTAMAVMVASPALAQPAASTDAHAAHAAHAAHQGHASHAAPAANGAHAGHEMPGGCCDGMADGKMMPCCEKMKAAGKKMDCCDKQSAARAAPDLHVSRDMTDPHAGHGMNPQ